MALPRGASLSLSYHVERILEERVNRPIVSVQDQYANAQAEVPAIVGTTLARLQEILARLRWSKSRGSAFSKRLEGCA